MQIDLGDAPAWAALLVSTGSLLIALRATRHAKDSAAASQDSALSARRSADAAERQAEAAEAALPPPPPHVAWRVEWVGGQRYRLRNTGVGVATGVQIDTGKALELIGFEGSLERIPPNGSVSFLITESAEISAPDELLVTWDGQDEPVVVPVP